MHTERERERERERVRERERDKQRESKEWCTGGVLHLSTHVLMNRDIDRGPSSQHAWPH